MLGEVLPSNVQRIFFAIQQHIMYTCLAYSRIDTFLIRRNHSCLGYGSGDKMPELHEVEMKTYSHLATVCVIVRV